MLKSIIKTILLGRENGFRQSILSRLTNVEDTSPNSVYPSDTDTGGVVYGGSNKMEPPKNVTPPDGFEVVLHRNAIKNGELTEVIVAGTSIAVVKVNETVYALENDCPLSRCPLTEGALKEDIITCAYHGLEIKVTSGNCLTNPDFKVPSYSTHIEGDAICVQL